MKYAGLLYLVHFLNLYERVISYRDYDIDLGVFDSDIASRISQKIEASNCFSVKKLIKNKSALSKVPLLANITQKWRT